MLRRRNLTQSEIYELLSVCSLNTKQLNRLLFLNKEAQQFKKYPLIHREKIQQLSAGRPTFYMSVKPNKLSLVSLKRGELLTRFVSYVDRNLGWLVCQYKRLSDTTLSVMIFDTPHQKQYENIYLHFVTHQDFKEEKLVKGQKNIFLCEDNLFTNKIALSDNLLYFTLQSSKLKVVKVEVLGSSQKKRDKLQAVPFKALNHFFESSVKEYTKEINKCFMNK